MKQLKMIAIALLLIVCTMKPFIVDAAGESKVRLESCEKSTLINIFNNSSRRIDTSYESIATEYYNNICNCSYYDCAYNDGGNYDEEKINDFILYAQTLFEYINRSGDISALKKASDKDKRITEFEELINSSYVNDLAISKYYQCSLNKVCSGVSTGEEGEKIIGVEGCKGFIGQDTANLIKEILNYLRIFGPLALIIYSALDYARAVAGKYDGNEDALETAKIKVRKRLLAFLLFLIIPTLVLLVFGAIEGNITIPTDCVFIFKNMFLWR